MTIAKIIVEEIILKFGIPQMILIDQGSIFLSEIFTNVCKLLIMKNIKCTAYHPQSNGALERTHRVLVEYLRCFILEDLSNWDKWLTYATFVLNTTPHTATGFTAVNYYLVGNPIYLAYYRMKPLRPSMHMTIMLKSYSLDYSPVIN